MDTKLIRPRRLLTALVAAALCVAGLATPSGATAPQRDSGTRNCVTDASGRAIVTYTPPFNGVVAFQGIGSAKVLDVGGDEVEVLDGGTSFPTTGFAKATASIPIVVLVQGPPSTPCSVGYGADATPANDSPPRPRCSPACPAARPVRRARRRSTRSTSRSRNRTRTASSGTAGPRRSTPRACGSTSIPRPAPATSTPGRTSRRCASRYTGPTTPPHRWRSRAIPSPTVSAAHGGSVEVDVIPGTAYRIAVCSGGGVGDFLSTHGYTAPGAFTLSWVPAGQPTANGDVAWTDIGQTVDVLHNDTDPQGDPLSIIAADPHGTAGGTITPQPATNPTKLFYRPPVTTPRFRGVDGFDYTISDGHGGTSSAHVTVFIDVPATQPLVTVSPATIDFGAVPLGKTKDAEVTFTNISAGTIGLTAFRVDQAQPQPFDASLAPGTCLTKPAMPPGDSCTTSVRFWSVAGANAASPASLKPLVAAAFEVGLGVPLVASTAPPEPPDANIGPVAVEDLLLTTENKELLLEPLDNDHDPDDDIMTITNATDPPHGTAAIVRCRDVQTFWWISPQATCIRYTPDAGFQGVDVFTYTISDGRGGTDSAKHYISVNAQPTITSLTPFHVPVGVPQSVLIQGANFVPASHVDFTCDGVVHELTNTTLSTTEISVSVPAMGVTTCDVEVRYPFGVNGLPTATLVGGYTVGNTPLLLPGKGTITEGDSGTKTLNIPVTLSFAPTHTVTAQWNTVHINAGNESEAKPGDDYVAASGTVSFAAGQTNATVPVTIKGDALDEYDELFAVRFHGPTNATIGGFYGLGFGSITDDDALPTIVPDFGALSVPEGSVDSVVPLNVTLDAPSGRTATAHFRMPFAGGDGVAEPSDYVVASGDISFPPGATHANVLITVHGDTALEEDELVGVAFSNPVNANLGGVFGIGAIRLLNDD